MKVFATALLLITAFSSGAYALTIDQTGNKQGAAANFEDPDDSIPFPHISDDGQPQNFQGQAINNGNFGFGFSSSSQQPNAFQRAQERMGE